MMGNELMAIVKLRRTHTLVILSAISVLFCSYLKQDEGRNWETGSQDWKLY